MRMPLAAPCLLLRQHAAILRVSALVMEKSEEAEATPEAYRHRLVQQRAGKHQRAAGRRQVKLAPELRKPDLAAFVFVRWIEIEAERELAMGGEGRGVVSMGTKPSPAPAIVAADPRQLELHDPRLEGPQDRRQHATHQRVAQCPEQPLLVDRNVVTALAWASTVLAPEAEATPSASLSPLCHCSMSKAHESGSAARSISKTGSLAVNHARFARSVEPGNDRGHLLGESVRRDCRQPTGGIDDDRRRPRRPDGAREIAGPVDQRRRTRSSEIRRPLVTARIAASHAVSVAASASAAERQRRYPTSRSACGRHPHGPGIEDSAGCKRQHDPRHRIADLEAKRGLCVRHPSNPRARGGESWADAD